jgi:hippurate hydrolase
MRRFLLLALIAASGTAQTLEQRIDREMPSLLTTYKTLHASPELSMKEQKTSAFVASKLRELGYDVTERVGKYQEPDATCYGVVAVMRNGEGPVVLVRSDMDALPINEQTGLSYASATANVMHACGHDLHMTTLLGTAKILADTKSQWRGIVMLVGQPAEELVKGARAMLADSMYERFPRPNYAIAVHDWALLESGKVGYRPGYVMANGDSVDITVRGVSGHGAAPDKSKDPVVIASEIVVALQTIVSRENSPLDPVVVTVGSIHGGSKRNIIPDEVKLLLTVRTYKPDVRQRVLASIDRIAKGIAQAAGVPADRSPIVEVLEGESTPATYNDPALTERWAAALRRELGSADVVPMEPVMVSEDFGRFSLDGKIPAVMLMVGAADPAKVASGAPLPSLHSSQFAPTPVALVLKTAVRTVVTGVMELMKR